MATLLNASTHLILLSIVFIGSMELGPFCSLIIYAVNG
ncbi:hypothetical protein BT93_I1526 [Corymbia citriodora subsp. variegata]|nr:hypothetical protein BT93_I1526 [Corymbia citriodora subsp. variegata]